MKMSLRKDVKPYCVTTARWIPFLHLLKVKTELERLEGESIIKKFPPTDRLVRINCLNKKRGVHVRLCVGKKDSTS